LYVKHRKVSESSNLKRVKVQLILDKLRILSDYVVVGRIPLGPICDCASTQSIRQKAEGLLDPCDICIRRLSFNRIEFLGENQIKGDVDADAKEQKDGGDKAGELGSDADVRVESHDGVLFLEVLYKYVLLT
jgi:hypothetical protein